MRCRDHHPNPRFDFPARRLAQAQKDYEKNIVTQTRELSDEEYLDWRDYRGAALDLDEKETGMHDSLLDNSDYQMLLSFELETVQMMVQDIGHGYKSWWRVRMIFEVADMLGLDIPDFITTHPDSELDAVSYQISEWATLILNGYSGDLAGE